MASITIQNGKGKASGSCRFRCCVGRDELGKQVFRTTTVPYPTGLTPAKAKKQLEQQAYVWEEKEREKYKSGIVLTDRDTITLVDFIEKHWLPDYVEDGQHKPSGVAYYTGLSKIVVSYFGRKVRLKQIDLEKVKRFIKYMNVDAKTRGGKAYGRSTVQHAFGVLRNIMEYARRLHYIDVDPCLDLTPREKPQRERKKIDYLTSAEARQYLSCLEGEPLLWQCFEYLLLTAGLRRGECLGLQWGDLDRKALTLKISRNVTVDRNSPEKYHVGTTKTGDTRTVPISARMDGMLLRLRREYEQKHGLLLPNAFIFCRDTDPYKPLYPTAPTRWQSRFVERYHLHPVSPHDLRHTAATLALESGADLKQIQELLGHRDPSTTLAFYTGISEEAKRQTVDGIERMLGQTGEEGE